MAKTLAGPKVSISQPRFSNECWVEKRSYVGSLLPQFTRCTKTPRPNHLTCHWHQQHEERAQRIKARKGG